MFSISLEFHEKEIFGKLIFKVWWKFNISFSTDVNFLNYKLFNEKKNKFPPTEL